MRFALAVAAAAAAQVVIFLRVGDWLGVSAALALAYLLAAAAGGGFFAGRRAPLAGFLSVVCGALSYGIVAYATRETEADLWSLAGWEARLAVSVLPYAAGGALAGWAGGGLRSVALRR